MKTVKELININEGRSQEYRRGLELCRLLNLCSDKIFYIEDLQCYKTEKGDLYTVMTEEEADRTLRRIKLWIN
jgi:hypothetical protein